MLHKNQQNAVNITLNNNFESGIHFHATGTGKSWVALQLILAFNEKYKHTNIFWICERKSILIEQFSSKTLKERGYEDVFKNFNGQIIGVKVSAKCTDEIQQCYEAYNYSFF
tara:strand:+ start:1480 stop:1815 length:336 start_codon:yes stop_codon:yes gene_type:complete